MQVLDGGPVIGKTRSNPVRMTLYTDDLVHLDTLFVLKVGKGIVYAI